MIGPSPRGRDDDGEDGSPYHASLSKVRRALDELLQQQQQQPGGGEGVLPDRVDPHKVLLGIPAYARHLRHPGQVRAFGEIYDGVMMQQDDVTKDILAWDEDLHSWEGYEWESPNRIREKVNLARERGLGGVFFWEAGQDKATEDHPGGVLLEAAARAARHDLLVSSATTPSITSTEDAPAMDDQSHAEEL
jgi:Glycosyl hydrolases family 18